jgi:hypothetical protein
LGDEPLSPSPIDERRAKHEASASGESGERPQPGELPQFTLRGLFAFLTATAVCLSLAASGFRVSPQLGMLLGGSAAILAWVVLLVTYWRLRQQLAIIVHWVCMGVALAFGGASLLNAAYLLRSDPAEFLFRLVWTACVLGSALSLPVFVVTMVGLLVKAATGTPRSRGQLERGSDETPQRAERSHRVEQGELVEPPRDHPFGVDGGDGHA